jgi:hypothetical protein
LHGATMLFTFFLVFALCMYNLYTIHTTIHTITVHHTIMSQENKFLSLIKHLRVHVTYTSRSVGRLRSK